MMHGYGWYGNGFCDSVFGRGYFGISQYLILIGIIIIVVALVMNRKSKKVKDSTAEESLKMLYVKGEISEEEYLKRKNVIERK
jgi:putative membrane protein